MALQTQYSVGYVAPRQQKRCHTHLHTDTNMGYVTRNEDSQCHVYMFCALQIFNCLITSHFNIMHLLEDRLVIFSIFKAYYSGSKEVYIENSHVRKKTLVHKTHNKNILQPPTDPYLIMIFNVVRVINSNTQKLVWMKNIRYPTNTCITFLKPLHSGYL